MTQPKHGWVVLCIINKMICLRCGYCCVVSEIILPDTQSKPTGKECPYLEWDENIAVCKIHGQEFEIEGHKYTWEETPCGRHDQIGKLNADCRMGAFCKRKGYTGRDFIMEQQ